MGKRVILILALILILAPASLFAKDQESRLMRFPDIYGDKIVFSYAGDLWIVSSEGGLARRLTSYDGYELFAKFSPDGKQIAFSGNYDGNMDVYIIPVEGGTPKRLTYHPYGDMVLDWHPSGKKILFRSTRDAETNPGPRLRKLYTVSVNGGLPDKLPLFEGELTSYSPDGKKIAYNRISREFRTWKRYMGGMAQDIWLYDFENNKSERLTTYKGTDAFPMWYKDRIYFISDRDHTMNIYCLDLATKKIRKVTNHKDYDVKWPSLGKDRIVYENGGCLYVLDLNTEKTKKLSITVPSERIFTRPTYKRVGKYINAYDISRTGKRAVFEARGDIFTVPAEKGEPRNITRTPGIRERNPAWSPDGKWIAYFSDKTGEYEIYLKKPDGTGKEIQVTKGGKGWQWYMKWSPDSKKLLFSDKTYTLYYVEVDENKPNAPHRIDKGEITDIYEFSWSPDSKWVAYQKAGDNLFGSIYLYSLEKDKSFKVTSDFYDDYDPVFDPDGKYLYFFSNRSWYPLMSRFEHNFSYTLASDVCVVTLAKDTPNPFAPESDEEEVVAKEEKKEDSKDKKSEKKKKNDKKEKKEEKGEKPVKIDIEGFEGRIVSLPIEPGNYYGLSAASGKIFYVSVPDMPMMSDRQPNLSGVKLMMYNMKKRKEKKVIGGIKGYALSADGNKILYRSQQDIFGIIDAAPGGNVGDGKIATNELEMKVDPIAEWEQIFNEAWRLERDFFYDPNMHGVDWPYMKKHYGTLLPYVSHREDLNYIIGEMIAELCSSHTYVFGGDMPHTKRVSVGLLGCDFELDKKSGLYKIKKIYKGRNWDKRYVSPLTLPGIDVHEGDYILAVNGTELKAPTNPFSLLENTVGKQTVIKVSSKPSGKDAKEYTVVPVASETWLRYNDWVESNRRKVAEATGGRVGYIHVPNTSLIGLNEFASSFYPQVNKDGLIIDVRYNSGGFIPDMFVERLSRKLLALWARREGKSFLTPWTAPRGPMVCIINGYAGSGGDAFPYFFREKGLGPLIGTRTWGGLIGISRGITLTDGGRVTMPDFGLYNLEGKWDVENVGVSPDIEVDNRPDLVVKGHDPQLEKAIEVILQKLKESPPRLPKKPKYPIKN